MPIEWAIIFLGTIVAAVYFSYNSGMKYGVQTATLLTLAKLESEGLIHFNENGNIRSGRKSESKETTL
jgi:uncharacterized protein YjiK